ncbi:MAG: fimbrillin family protein, partial [Mucinivorans sp.]
FNSATDPYMGTTSVGVQIKHDGKEWGYADPTKTCYWPDATTDLVFYGYTPFASAVVPGFTKAGGMVFTNYVVPTDVAAQKDFMWAYTSTKKAPNVAMAFNHALVRVNFKAKMVTPNMKVDIEANGITICNIMNKGTATVAPVTAPATPAVAWATAADATAQQIIVPSAAVTIENATVKDVSLIAADQAVMLMPQTFAAWDPQTGTITAVTAPENKNGYLKVMCKIYSATAPVTYYHGTATESVGGAKDDYKPIYIPLSSIKLPSTDQIWKANNNITYTLNFGGGYADDGTPILNPTLFTTTVKEWTKTDGGILPM